MEIKKPVKKYKSKRPTRDEFEMEELGERLVEAKEEESDVVLAVWDADPVRGKIVEMDARTKQVHVQRHGELTKVPFMDIMRVDNASD
ncbi:YolD-like family protein [Cohnella sp. JJ-181]|uniref:YolD-like family protein n=1 Tax=Cohnella rhizoplanae TaxID=2974897 RepID=UPI0022FF56DB|nr:YolD-like family protein [Cohnella sp. JJ-181]CAI6086730.1 hypothetical protein COHCIP112018_05149 [Cohnella sp. JJ-181]